MDDNKDLYSLNFINDFYIKQKKKEMKKLETEKDELEKEIQYLESKLVKSNELLSKIKFENTLLNDQYNSVKRVLKERGIIIDIFNNNFSVNQWDNLEMKKIDSKYSIVTKKGEMLKTFDELTSSVFTECIEEEQDYSLIVIRVEGRTIKVQLRIKRRE